MLPLFFPTLLLLFLPFQSLQAQSPSAAGTESGSDARLDVLFDQIMETLPEEKRMKVDSAGTTRPDPRAGSHDPLSGTRQIQEDHSERLRELPEELRIQVERVITDIEQRKEERKERFRESQRKK